jgi:hypothetical protein
MPDSGIGNRRMNRMASIRSMLRAFALAGALVGLAMASTGVLAGGQPTLVKGKGDKCVEDTQYMRRNHMDLLSHHRDLTMREGIRTKKHSLKGCVECHASEKTGSVAANKEDFCSACHVYAAVKVDCWSCHATKPKAKPMHAAPMASSAKPGGSTQ